MLSLFGRRVPTHTTRGRWRCATGRGGGGGGGGGGGDPMSSRTAVPLNDLLGDQLADAPFFDDGASPVVRTIRLFGG